MTDKPLKRTFSNKLFGKKDEKTGEDAPKDDEKKLSRTLSISKLGRKSEDGSDAEKPVLKRTFSSKFGKKKEDGSDRSDVDDEKPVLKRTFSNKLFGKKDEKTGEDAPKEDEKKLSRTLSISKLGRKSEDGSDAEKPVLKRTFSQKFQKEEKKKLKARFDIRVVRISKCQINNTTVFLGWNRPATSVGGDTKRAVVTDCCATFGDTISVEAVLSLPNGSDKFKPSIISFELKEDKLVRKGAGKAKWHVLGRGQFDLADYTRAQKSLCIIPLIKKKANIQLELEVTAIWQHYDGQRFEQMLPSNSTSSNSGSSAALPPTVPQKKVESIGNAKYTVASDSEVDVYTEEDVDLNLSEIVSDEDDEDYKSAFSAANNPFQKQDEEDKIASEPPATSSFGSLLSSLAGSVSEPERPKRDPPKKVEEKKEEVKKEEVMKKEEVKKEEVKKEEVKKDEVKKEEVKKEEVKKEELKKPVVASPESTNPFEKKPIESTNPFEKKVEKVANSQTTCHDCKHENKVGWKFCDTCGARSKADDQKKADEQKKVVDQKKVLDQKKTDEQKQDEQKKIDEQKKKIEDQKKAEQQKKIDDQKKKVDLSEEQNVVHDVRPPAASSVDDLRALVDQQRREILSLKESERKFSNAVTLAERKALAAETLLQGKERELKRLVVQRSAASGGSSEDVNELLKQVSELEVELRSERRRGEFQTMMENVIFLCSFSFTKDNESVAALKMFDEFIRLSLFDESFARQNIVLMDHLLNTIVLICQNPKVPQEVTQYWIVSAVHLLKLIKDGMKRLKSAVSGDHPLLHMEKGLGELATTLYTRLFTVTLRKIESLLIASLGSPFQSAAYFRPDELVMGEILREFSGLMSGFKANRWTSAMIELFFKFCVDLVNRFLANKIIQERKFCTLLNGIKIKMEVSFLIEWMLKHPETQVLIGALDHVLEAANVLIMSKQRNNALTEFKALNVRQIHAILSQYQPQAESAAPSSAANKGAFPVVPSGLSKSSQEIVERIEKAKGSLPVAEKTDEVDALLLKRLEADDSFSSCDLLIVDQLAEDIEKLKAFLNQK